ncbi:MAG: hypothetical protein GY699_12915 [Desulfobacteraceae bacterium]|nr:hypothetical protein [Desulfobacteraceae bacterium]
MRGKNSGARCPTSKDERYLLAYAKYIELNPVRAGLIKKPDKWPWSSTGPHMKEKDDILVKTKPLRKMIYTNWKRYLGVDVQ